MLFKSNILNKVDKIRREALDNGSYTLFNCEQAKRFFQEGMSNDTMESFFELFSEWDNYGNSIPFELGCYLEELINNPEISVGIHRTSIDGDVFNSKILSSICEKGLINSADLSYGAFTDKPEPNKTISFVERMLNLVIMLKSSYKGSEGCVLVAIPSAYFTKDGDMKKEHFEDIYNVGDIAPTIKPEYIKGYIGPFEGEYKLFAREEILSNKKSTNF